MSDTIITKPFRYDQWAAFVPFTPFKDVENKSRNDRQILQNTPRPSSPNGFVGTIDYSAPKEFEPMWKMYTVIDEDTHRTKLVRRKNKCYKGMLKEEIEKSIEEQKRTYPERLEEYKQKKEEKGYQKQCERLKITFYMFYFEDLDLEIQETINNNVSSIITDSISWKEKYKHLQNYISSEIKERNLQKRVKDDFVYNPDGEYANVEKNLGKEN